MDSKRYVNSHSKDNKKKNSTSVKDMDLNGKFY